MSKGELDEEERKRKNKVRALRPDCKLTYDEWITNGIEKIECSIIICFKIYVFLVGFFQILAAL